MVCALWASRVRELQRSNWGLLPLRLLGTFARLWSFLFFLHVLHFPSLVVIQEKKKTSSRKIFCSVQNRTFFLPPNEFVFLFL